MSVGNNYGSPVNPNDIKVVYTTDYTKYVPKTGPMEDKIAGVANQTNLDPSHEVADSPENEVAPTPKEASNAVGRVKLNPADEVPDNASVKVKKGVTGKLRDVCNKIINYFKGSKSLREEGFYNTNVYPPAPTETISQVIARLKREEDAKQIPGKDYGTNTILDALGIDKLPPNNDEKKP